MIPVTAVHDQGTFLNAVVSFRGVEVSTEASVLLPQMLCPIKPLRLPVFNPSSFVLKPDEMVP